MLTILSFHQKLLSSCLHFRHYKMYWGYSGTKEDMVLWLEKPSNLVGRAVNDNRDNNNNSMII